MAVWSTVAHLSVTAGICANAKVFKASTYYLVRLTFFSTSLQFRHIPNFPTLRLPLSLLSNITVVLRSFSVSLIHHSAYLAAGSLSYW